MKQIKVKPLVSISTYEERQRAQQLRNNEVDRDLPDSVVQVASVIPAPVATAAAVVAANGSGPTKSNQLATKNHFMTNGKTSPSPPPPPPPEPSVVVDNIVDFVELAAPPPIEFADDAPKAVVPTAVKSTTVLDNHPNTRRNYNTRFEGEKPVTPTPDYDSLSYASSSEEPSSNGGNIPLAPPPQKLILGKQSSLGLGGTKGPAPPKPNRSISVTIGEYGRNGDTKREPSKLGFLNRQGDKYDNNSGNASEMLKNELQMTLSRSNLMKSSDSAKVPPPPLPAPKAAVQGNGPMKSKSVLEKTGAANIERLTSMLTARNQLITHNTSNGNVNGRGVSSTTTNGSVVNDGPSSVAANKVTISIPKTKSVLDSEVKISPNGILKTANGSNGISANAHSSMQANGEAKNIKFDNITTVIGIRK